MTAENCTGMDRMDGANNSDDLGCNISRKCQLL